MSNIKFNDYFQKCDSKTFHCDSINYNIEYPYGDKKAYKIFNQIYTACFSEFKIFDINIADKPKNLFSHEDDMRLDEQFLAYHFIDQKYSYPNLNKYSFNKKSGNFDDIDKISRDDVYQSFYEDIQSNNNIFLIGSIGDGKSTLIKKLCLNMSNDFNETKYLPFYIDILDPKFELDNYEKLFNSTLEKIKDILEISKITITEINTNETKEESQLNIQTENSSKISLFSILKSEIKANTNNSSIDINQNQQSTEYTYEIDNPLNIIRNFNKRIKKSGYKMILFLDNLDTLNYDNERYMLFDEEEGYHKFNNKVKLVRSYIKEMMLSFKNSAIPLVFALRPYVRSHFALIQQNTFDQTLAENTVEYKITGNYSEEILDKRAELLDEICTKINTVDTIKKTTFEKVIELSKEYQCLYKNIFHAKEKLYANTLKEFYNISSQGYRTIVNFYHDLEFYPDVYESLFSHDVIQLYKLDFYKSFSQILPNKCHKGIIGNHSGKKYSYPNIFLVVTSTDCNENISSSCQPNYFTYWLKYLILLYVSHEKDLKIKEILNVFLNNGSSYDDHSVRLVLGSLGTSNEYNCIRYNFNSNEIDSLEKLENETHINSTRLGQYIIKNELSFSLLDLQFFVEDWLLPKPRLNKIFDEIIFDEEVKELNYNYLLSEEKKFTKMIKYKAKKSILFLFFLEYSLKYEQEKYKLTWTKIKEKVGNKYIFKNEFFKEKRQNIIDEVMDLFKYHDKTKKDKHKSELNDFINKCDRKKEIIDNFFKDVYENNLKVDCANNENM